MRAIVFAYHEIGYVCLEELISSGIEVLCLFTHEDDPGEDIWFHRPVEIAKQLDIPVYTPQKLKEDGWIDLMVRLAPDFIFSFYYRNMIPLEVLDIARMGAFNLHGSLLPKFRGRCPVNWVLIEGEKQTGLTLHYMLEKPDAGEVVAQKAIDIAFDDTAFTLFLKMAAGARDLMKEVLPSFKAGIIESAPQVGQSSYYGGRRPEDGLIFWEKDAAAVYNLVRATTHPYPGAFTFLDGKRFHIWQAYPHDDNGKGDPGEILLENGLAVRARNGVLELLRVQLEGEEEMDGNAFALIHVLEGKRLGGKA